MSGVDLIGPVPPRWNVKPLRLIGRLLKGSGGSKEDAVDEGVPCVRYGELYTTHRNFIERARTYITQERAPDYTPLEYGDVLFAASGETIEEIGKSAVNLLHGARCGGDVVILRPTGGFVPRFLGYATDAAPVAAQKSLAGRGSTVKHIYPDELREVVIAIPPADEQQAIVDFLDWETARIDALVTAKERLLDLLAEKRKAIIATAVTRGLDPKVKLRDSGVPWLGEIPAHWDVVPFRWYFRIGSGDFIATDEVASERDWTRATPVIGGNGIAGYCSSANTTDDQSIVIGRVGAQCGNVHVVDGAAWVTDNALLLRNIREYVVEYLALVLRQRDLNSIANKTAQPLITGSMVTELRGPLPTIDEQRAVVAHIARETAKLDAVRAATERTIALLKERRSALIAAAVTGQLDVGTAA